MTSIRDIAVRFAERVSNPDLRQRSSQRSNVFTDGDTIYSYGRHFVIARVLRDVRGNARCILFNGDTYSVSTGRHQSDVRAAIRQHAADVPTIIIPFAALTAAGIDHDSIVPIDVHAERWEYTRNVAGDMPEGAEQVSCQKTHWRDDWDASGFARLRATFDDSVPDPDNVRWKALLDSAPKVWAVQTGGEWQEIRREGDSFVWFTRRHWLGDSLFAARSNGRRRRVKFLSSFDRQERTPLYFLCELPATTATTVDEALEALKPDPVILAEAVGRKVTRQGDIFAVPMPGLTRAELREQGATFGKRSEARKGIAATARYDAIFTRLVQAEDVRFTTPDMLEVLAARSAGMVFGRTRVQVRARPIADMWGRSHEARMEARRRVDSVSRHRRERWERILREREQAAHAAALDPRTVSMLGTSHTGTEVATMPDGTQYARGVMYHDPALMGEDRERDHARQKMGDGQTWHLIVKNTVPVQ